MEVFKQQEKEDRLLVSIVCGAIASIVICICLVCYYAANEKINPSRVDVATSDYVNAHWKK